MYCDEVYIHSGIVLRLAYLSDKYLVHKLKEDCIAYFKQYVLTVNNVLDHMEQSQYIIPEIQKAIMFMIQLHPKAILEKGYKDLSLESLRSILQQDFINCSEYYMYRVCYCWAWKKCKSHKKSLNGKNIRKEFGDLLHLIRFPAMSIKEFALVSKNEVLTSDERCKVFEYLAEDRANKKIELPFDVVSRSNYTVCPYTERSEVFLCDPLRIDLSGPVNECRKGCLAFKFTRSVAVVAFRLQLNELMSPNFGEDPIPLRADVVSRETAVFPVVSKMQSVQACPMVCKRTRHRYHEVRLKEKRHLEVGKIYVAVIHSEVPLCYYKASEHREGNDYHTLTQLCHQFSADKYETEMACRYKPDCKPDLIHGIKYEN